MDTRRKIVSPEGAAAVIERLRKDGKTVNLASGYFDPLLAEHARRLGDARSACDVLVVLVATPPEPVLPETARAELVAALAAVDYVVLHGRSGAKELLARIPASEVVHFESADEEATRELIRHVRSRHDAN